MQKIRSLFKIRYLVIFIIIAGGVYFWFSRQAAQVKERADEGYTVTRSNLVEALSFSGEIDAKEEVTLRFQSAGKLSWVGVKEGDYVKKYQGVASLDQREIKNRLSKYLNTYSKERLDFDQTTYDNRDVNIGGLTKDQQDAVARTLQQSQADLNNAVLDVELQDLARQYSHLSTPIEGIVVEVTSPYPGVNITAAGAEFVIVNPATVYFSATADQTDVWKLTEGMTGDVTLDAYPDEVLKGIVSRIDFVPREDESGTVYGIEIALEGPSDIFKYRMGMTGDISFTLREKADIISVPTRLVKTDKDDPYVLAVIDGKVTEIPVETGEAFDGETEIVSGLNEGTIIVE